MPNPPNSRITQPGTPPKSVANDNPPRETQPPLGAWRDGHFEFASPAAREIWHRSAYAQGVSPQNWHQGTEIDDRTYEIIKAGLGGPTPPYYRGPDGKHRFGNLNTLEPSTLRNIRARHLQGRSMDDLEATFATTGKMLGEDEAVAHVLAPSHRPRPAALSTNAAAILGGMEQARKTKPEIGATLAQADTSNATEPPLSTKSAQEGPDSFQSIPAPTLLRGPHPPKKPSAPMDALRKAELLIFQPAGDGQSSLGHVAIEIKGLLYSWTPSGLHLTTKQEYLAKNNFRDATGYPLRLTDNETDRLESYILKYANTARYNPMTANCTDMVEQGLEPLGYNVGLTALPAQLQKALIANQLASKDRSTFYPADPSEKSPPATMPWSVISRPE